MHHRWEQHHRLVRGRGEGGAEGGAEGEVEEEVVAARGSVLIAQRRRVM